MPASATITDTVISVISGPDSVVSRTTAAPKLGSRKRSNHSPIPSQPAVTVSVMLVGVIVVRASGCPLAMERHEHQPEHVGGGQQRRQQADSVEQPVAAHVRFKENLVLAEEAGKRPNAGNRNGADEKRPVGNR